MVSMKEPGALLRKGLRFADAVECEAFVTSASSRKKAKHNDSDRVGGETINVHKTDPSDVAKTALKSDESIIDSRISVAQFRMINERLYTQSSAKSLSMFKVGESQSVDGKSMFQTYHDGYMRQVKRWPADPLDTIVKDIKHRYSTNKTDKNFVVVDMGCGMARLRDKIVSNPKLDDIVVKNIDLVASDDDVIACDMAHTPLSDNEADVVVFSMSLMGTNTKDFVIEARRIMKIGGLMIIVEPESRFAETTAKMFSSIVTRYGFESKKMANISAYFVIFHFIKTDLDIHTKSMAKKLTKLTDIRLKPCLYKTR